MYLMFPYVKYLPLLSPICKIDGRCNLPVHRGKKFFFAIELNKISSPEQQHTANNVGHVDRDKISDAGFVVVKRKPSCQLLYPRRA